MRASIRHLALGCGLLLAACTGTPNKPKPQTDDEVAASRPSGAAPQKATAPANGWGEDIAWRPLKEGFEQAKDERRPIMLVVHTDWCSNCKKLKPTFKEKKFTELTRDFVMINANQDTEPAVKAFAPDGDYIPRVVFFTPDGALDEGIKNSGNPRYKYFYSPVDDLQASMREALKRHGEVNRG